MNKDAHKVNPNVEHPKHYNQLGAKCPECQTPIECITVVQHMSFNLGNAIKYIWRCLFKNNPIEDLEKATWYVKQEIQLKKESLKDDNK